MAAKVFSVELGQGDERRVHQLLQLRRNVGQKSGDFLQAEKVQVML